MPLRNRVTPWGEIVATPERGTLMGNRGCLHDADRHVTKAWARVPWVACLLEYKGRHRQVMAPGKYTELFFLDEATTLAAGHRPCATCRRGEYEAFKTHWIAANPELSAARAGSIQQIDRHLHAERVDRNRRKRVWSSPRGQLPDGAMVVAPGTSEPLILWQDAAFAWSPGGYGDRQALDPATEVIVLTPRSMVQAIAHGYAPGVHSSLDG